MYRILAISGGGVRGYLTLEILKYIEEKSGRRISDMFDLVIGTSSGALIGLLLDTLSAEYSSNLFKNSLKDLLFHKNLFSLGGILQSKYNTEAKTECLSTLLRYKDSVKNFDWAAVSYDIKNAKPVIFNTLETEETNTYSLIKEFRYVDAVLGSSAAPLYWDPHKYNDKLLIDGALCANNPVSIGIKLALNKDIKLEDLHIVSIGTGIATRKYNFTNGANPIKWIEPLFNIMMNGNSNTTNMLYENESLYYYNLDVPLIYAKDEIDNISASNLDNLILDAEELIKLKETELHSIIQTF